MNFEVGDLIQLSTKSYGLLRKGDQGVIQALTIGPRARVSWYLPPARSARSQQAWVPLEYIEPSLNGLDVMLELLP